jgi:hypothetical protein
MAVKRYNGTTWDTVAGLGTQGAAAESSSITTWVKTATGGETSLTGSSDSSTTLAYTPGQEQFFINGVLQVRGSDYTATNGTSITGITALVAGDVATVTTVNAFSVTGAVPLSTVTANGDLIVGTSSGAVGRLGIGSSGQVLAVSGGVPAWTSVSSGSLTSLATGSLSGASVNLTSISSSYTDLRLVLRGISVSASASLILTVNGTSSIYGAGAGEFGTALTGNYNIAGANQLSSTATNGFVQLSFYNYTNTTSLKKMSDMFVFKDTGATNFYVGETSGAANITAAINQITVTVSGGNSFDAGTYTLYGVN